MKIAIIAIALLMIPGTLAFLHREKLQFEFDDARVALRESSAFGPPRGITCIRGRARESPFRSLLNEIDDIYFEWRIRHPMRGK